MHMFILAEDGKTPVGVSDPEAWAAWMIDLSNRIVAKDVVGEVSISTVFLGIDHNFGSTWKGYLKNPKVGIPALVLWETMTFGGYTEYRTSYASENDKKSTANMKLGCVEMINRSVTGCLLTTAVDADVLAGFMPFASGEMIGENLAVCLGYATAVNGYTFRD